MLRDRKQDNEALAGVAALIVFIALVLVAAIASTVILDVTGELEQQASNTGEEAEGQLSSTLSVVEAYGELNSSGDGVESINITVSAAPGADPIELNDTTIEITTADSSATLVPASNTESVNSAAGTYTITELVSENSTTNVLRRPQDRYRLDIDMTQAALDAQSLEENEQVELIINSGRGGKTFYEFTVPSTLSTETGTVTL